MAPAVSLDLLASVVRLRVAIQETRDAALRGELRAVEASLRAELGPSVPKRVASHALGVSVTALDGWIDRGILPAVASATGKRRLGVETGPLLDLSAQALQLRREGRRGGVIAEAVRRLGWRETGERLVLRHDVAALPRPNIPLNELQREFRETTPAERVLQMAALNRSLGALPQRISGG